ncbi:unnamed protein product [Ilex paraguariensis]|uniref:peroxidase n=1 Tax=Ilex paraguariensis TaxID=185542 RepID=A0ABC8TKC0_9AQUA
MAVLLPAFLTLALVLLVNKAQSLELHFYRNSCPQAELLVKRILQQHFSTDPSLPAGLLRLHFHDCFIRGCDGSILIDSTDANVAEKEAPPNLTFKGFEVIDEIKVELEKQCKRIVSCADILALAARDGVAFAGGAAYALPTGRPSSSAADALKAFQNISLDIDDLTTLLGKTYIPNINISTDPKVFMNPTTSTPFELDPSFYQGVLNEEAVLSLDQELAFTDVTRTIVSEYVAGPKVFRRKFAKAMIKLGGYTIGISHCSSFNNRLYNFTGKGDTDPTFDPNYIAHLKLKCKPGDQNSIVEMDTGSFKMFDEDYFTLVAKRRGLFQSDGITELYSKILKQKLMSGGRRQGCTISNQKPHSHIGCTREHELQSPIHIQKGYLFIFYQSNNDGQLHLQIKEEHSLTGMDFGCCGPDATGSTGQDSGHFKLIALGF